jgi:hypothetical protein
VTVDLTPDTRRYCRYDGLDGLGWVAALSSPQPIGPCDDKPLLYVLGTDADICERHVLQLWQAGVRVPVATTEPPRPPQPEPEAERPTETRQARRRRERLMRKAGLL